MALKYVQEYRDGDLAKKLISEINNLCGKNFNEPGTFRKFSKVRFMEVCGTHTMSIFRHGIPSVLPPNIELLSGPGCPVCVTSQKDIDTFIEISMMDNVILTTFGDLMRVPGTMSSLQKEKAAGRDIRIVYAALDAVDIAAGNPDKSVVFCAVGFETTTPTVAASILVARERGISNFFIHSAHKLTPPALAALMKTPGVDIDGFILPGHVSVITGTDAYRPVFDKYQIPSVIAGFEPVDILKAVLMLLKQNISGRPALKNAYPRAVAENGNPRARQIMDKVFKPGDASWRGIGLISDSGMELREGYNSFNADLRFDITSKDSPEPKGCACGEILMGLKTPQQCPLYRKICTPLHPVGPCMVSSEGACAAYFRYKVQSTNLIAF